MKTDKELLRRALNYLMLPGAYAYIDGVKALVEEIRARLSEPEDEPVRWLSSTGRVYRDKMAALMNDNFNEPIPLYRHPPRKPVRLSDEEIQECFDIAQKNFSKHQTGIKGQQLTIRDWPNWYFAKAIEKAILERNK